MSTFEWPPKGTGGGAGITIYPNFAAFPASAPNGTVAKDGGAHILYEYNSTTVMWEPIASNAAYEAALLVIAGTPYTFAGFDATGALETIPGWAFDPVSNGANVNLTYDPVVGSVILQNFVSDFSPSANSANDESGFNFLTTFDGQHLNNDNAATITGTSIGQVVGGNGVLDHQRALIVDQHSGNGTNTGVVSVQNVIEAYSDVTVGTTVVDGAGLTLQLNQNGTMTGGYFGINASANGGAIGAGLIGFSFNSNSNVGGGSILTQLTQNGSVGIDLDIIASTNNGAVGQNYFGLNFTNNGTVAQNAFFLNFNNQIAASIGGNFIGSSIANEATVAQFFTGMQVVNQNTITKGMTGYSLDNAGSIGDGTGTNLQAFTANLHGGSIAGGIIGFNLFNSMPVTTNDTIGGLTVNNSGAGYRFDGVSLTNNANQSEEIRGFQFNSTGDSRTKTLLDLTSTSGVVTNDYNGIRMTMGGTAQIVNGVEVDLSGVTLSTNAQKSGLSINDGFTRLNSNVDTSVFMPSGEWQHNLIGGQFHIAAGFPVSGSFGFGNNLGVDVIIEDDMAADNTLGTSSLGFSVDGMANQVSVASGKTIDTLTWMIAGGAVLPSSTGGAIVNATMFRALGLLPEGGTIAVTNMYGFKAEPLLSSVSPTNTWGVWVGDPNADNWFAKDVVIGGTTGQPEAGQALDVTGPVRLRTLTVPGVVTTDALGHLSSSPAGAGVATYANFAAFPPTAGDGSLAVALDTDILYVFNAATMTWLAIAQPGAIVPIIEEITITSTDVTNGFVTLAHTPNDPTEVLLAPSDGPVQVYLVDFTVSGASLIWTGFALNGVIAAGDILVVSYFWFDPNAIGGLGGGGIIGLTQTSDQYTLTPTDITNAFVTLSNTPNTPSAVILTVRGSVGQAYSLDYTVAGNLLSWSGLVLDGQLVSGDVISVNYFHT